MSKLNIIWDEFEEEVKNFEKEYMKHLLSKNAKREEDLSYAEWIYFSEKVDKAVERKFNKEAKNLVSIHIQETK